MLEPLRSRLTPDFLTFIAARLLGVGVKPLVLLVASLAARDRFAQDYALLVSALAGLFVLAGAQTHIAYYNRRFSLGAAAYYWAYRSYWRDTILHYFLVLPLLTLVALLWTHDPIILISILLLVGVEKFFDEDMRHAQFTQRYNDWSLAFAFRTIAPSLAVLSLLPFWGGRLIIAYTAIVLGAFAAYGGIRSRHFRFYFSQLRLMVIEIRHHGVALLTRFAKRWRQDLVFNQLWSFASVNILLVDRLLVANMYPIKLAEYVLFANIFNVTNIAHSLLYFVPRRAALIRTDRLSAWQETSRSVNLVPPLIYATAAVVVALALRHFFEIYNGTSIVLLGGFALFYVVQAINLVGIEYAFWRVDRKWLLICDVTIVAAVAATILTLRPPLEWIPSIAAVGLLIRLSAYQTITKVVKTPPPPKKPTL